LFTHFKATISIPFARTISIPFARKITQKAGGKKTSLPALDML